MALEWQPSAQAWLHHLSIAFIVRSRKCRFMSIPEFEVRPEYPEDAEKLKSLAVRSFGPGRFTRTAHRIREKGLPVDALSLTAWAGSEFAGSIRFTAISIGSETGALLLGPLMVEEKWSGQGCGRALVRRGLELAREAGSALVILVGDRPYYEQFGFVPVTPGQMIFPGPVDPARLLAVELEEGALGRFSGAVMAE